MAEENDCFAPSSPTTFCFCRNPGGQCDLLCCLEGVCITGECAQQQQQHRPTQAPICCTDPQILPIAASCLMGKCGSSPPSLVEDDAVKINTAESLCGGDCCDTSRAEIITPLNVKNADSACGGGGCCDTLTEIITPLSTAQGQLRILAEGISFVAIHSFAANVAGVDDVASVAQDVICLTYDVAVIGPRSLLVRVQEKFPSVVLYVEEALVNNSASQALKRSRNSVIFGILVSVPLAIFSFVLPQISETRELFTTAIIGAGMTIPMVIGFALSTPALIVLGFPLIRNSYLSLKIRRRPATLVSISVFTAYVYSVAMTITSIWFAEVGELFYETGPILMTLVILGRLLEQAAVKQTKSVLHELRKLQPTTAMLYDPTSRSSSAIELELVQPGDIVHVEPGSRIPIDGVVTFGRSAVDESMLTGESRLVPKHHGDHVYGGTLNQDGMLRVECTCIAGHSTIAGVCALVQNAQQSKVKSQRVADQISSYFVPVALAASLITLIVWILLGQLGFVTVIATNCTESNFTAPIFCNNTSLLNATSDLMPFPAETGLAIRFFITVLVIACPCAIALAVPTAIVVATGVAARHGILVKSGESFEKAVTIDAVVFDKTGTLTQGSASVSSIIPFETWTEEQVLSLLASAESNSEHVLAKAVMREIQSRALPWTEPIDFIAIPGMGVSCVVENDKILVGNRALLADAGIFFPPNIDMPRTLTFVYLAVNGQLAAVIEFSDPVRPESAKVIQWLKARDQEIWLVSGDHITACDEIATFLGIDNVRAGVLPAEKAEIVKTLQRCGRKVTMIGDGINDSVALAQSDLGISMCGGTDMATQAADAVLMRGDLTCLPIVFDLARSTFRHIKFNFVWAFCYNAVAILIAAGILYPVGGYIPPAAAGAGEILSIMPVLISSLLIRYYNQPQESEPNRELYFLDLSDSMTELEIC